MVTVLTKNYPETCLPDKKREVFLEARKCLHEEFQKENIREIKDNIEQLEHSSDKSIYRAIKECIENINLSKTDAFISYSPKGTKYQLRFTLINHKIDIEIYEISHPHSLSLMLLTPSSFFINTPIGKYNISCSISSEIKIDVDFIKTFVFDLFEYSHKFLVNKSWDLCRNGLNTTLNYLHQEGSIQFLYYVLEPLLYAIKDQNSEKISSICDRIETFDWYIPESIVYLITFQIFSFTPNRVPDKIKKDVDFLPTAYNSDDLVIEIRSLMKEKGVVPPKKEETAFFDEMRKMLDRYYSSLGIEKPLQEEKEPVTLEELTTPEEPLLKFTQQNRLKRPDGMLETPIDFVQRVYGDHMRALVFTSGDLDRIDKSLYVRVHTEAKEMGKDIGEVMLAKQERNLHIVRKLEADHENGKLSPSEAKDLSNMKHRLNNYKHPIYNFLKTLKVA